MVCVGRIQLVASFCIAPELRKGLYFKGLKVPRKKKGEEEQRRGREEAKEAEMGRWRESSPDTWVRTTSSQIF